MTIENDLVAAQYESWVYPQPISDMAEAVTKDKYRDLSDPALFRRKFWPKRTEPDSLDILIAGCGTNQAAYFAFKNPKSRVVGTDISEASLGHEKYLKQKHSLHNLELYQLPLEQTASLGITFDLIVGTGVLHHLPDPGAGLRRLRDVLKPHGVMCLMVYGYYPRVGVYMLQEAFRVLGLQQDTAGVEMVKHTLDVLPDWHHIHSYKAPDLGYDSGLVDTYLHRQDRAYTVPQVLRLVRENQLKFQAWLDNLQYAISAYMPQEEDPLRRLIETLPVSDQWRLAELIAQGLAKHSFLVCHVDRPETDYTLDFSGQAWLDYIPSLRPLIDIRSIRRYFEPNEEPPIATTIVERDWHKKKLDALEAALLTQIDGERPISEIIKANSLKEWDAAQHLQRSREFFRRMADWDHLLYEIP